MDGEEAAETADAETDAVRQGVIDALQNYLSPDNWPWDAVVRRNELIALIENVDGVDYLHAGHPTVPAGDIELTGMAPLVTYGTLNITAEQGTSTSPIGS